MVHRRSMNGNNRIRSYDKSARARIRSVALFALFATLVSVSVDICGTWVFSREYRVRQRNASRILHMDIERAPV